MTRLRTLVSLVVALMAVVGLLGCGGGGSGASEPAATAAPEAEADGGVEPVDITAGIEEPPAPEPTTAEEDIACVAMAHSLLVPLSPESDASNEVTLSTLLPDLDVLANEGPQVVRPDALIVAATSTTVESFDWASGTRPTRDVETAAKDLLAAYDRLIDWAASTCALADVYWGCATPVGFLLPGQVVTADTPAAGLTPEDALTGDRQRAEPLDRADDRVVFAWFDDRGLALRREVVVAVDGGWAPAGDISCR